MTCLQRIMFMTLVVAATISAGQWHWQRRHRKFDRGRKLTSVRALKKRSKTSGLRWGNLRIAKTDAAQHFLAVGTTGSGKSLIQRLLMRDVLPGITPGSDHRAVILDAKNDMPGFLRHVGVTCPVYSLNPFEARARFPQAVAWEVATDITSPARALNLAGALIPSQDGENNRYFTDAARQVVAAVIESFIRHSPGQWSFADLVYTLLCIDRVREVLGRDTGGNEVLEGFLSDQRTGFQVFTTIVSRMAHFKPVAALWQRCGQRLSIRDFLQNDAILLLGMDASTKIALDAINEIVFRTLVEEIDAQHDSPTRRTWIWVDEARLSGPLLRGEMIPYLAVKGRSKGACLVLAFQDIEGFREAAGDHVANEIVGQCSHKALLRLESEESAAWASRLVGQHESRQWLRSKPVLLGRGGSQSEQITRSDTVLASEFFTLPPTSAENGLSGYFLTPEIGVVRDRVSGPALANVFVPRDVQRQMCFQPQPERAQQLLPWSERDCRRLCLDSSEEATKKRRPSHTLARRRLQRTVQSDT